MTRYVLTALCVLLPAATSASPQQIEWKDPSPHAMTFVTVDENVRLEVLDWGGSGPPLVLLAGLGATAHAYDDFAPLLTARYRVLAITRRAHRRSSAPLTGYGFPRLADERGDAQRQRPQLLRERGDRWTQYRQRHHSEDLRHHLR